MSRDEIQELFSTEGIKKKRIYVTIPASRENAIKNLINVYMNIPEDRSEEVMDFLQKFTKNNP